MVIIVQRVKNASVIINDREERRSGKGLVLLVGFEKGDTAAKIPAMTQKLSNLRIFEDAEEKMNFSVQDIQGELLVVPNFTLAANLQKGNRPSFDNALEPKLAKALFDNFITSLRESGIPFVTGEFGASMEVTIVNDGPVTFFMKS